MRNTIMSIALTFKSANAKATKFDINETAILGVLSRIGSQYQELFFLNCGNHALVMAFGSESEALENAFDHHRNMFREIVLLTESESIQYFDDIISGEIWKEATPLEKLSKLNEAFDIADSMQTLGLKLYPIITSGVRRLRCNPTISGAQNSWVKAFVGRTSSGSLVVVKSPDLFFRFSVN